MRSMTITNFKGYTSPTTVEFSDITIHAGMNSVGKSTAVQALLLTRTLIEFMMKFGSASDGKREYKIPLNGPFDLNLGDYNQLLLSTHDRESLSEGNRMSCRVNGYGGQEFHFQAKEEAPFYLYCETENPFPDLEPFRCIPPPDSVCDRNLYQTAFYYINAERLGPRNFQNIGDAGASFCGYHGEYAFDVITRFFNQPVPPERRLAGKETLAPFNSQLECWMDYIIPGIRFRTNRNVQNRIADLSISQESLNTEFASPHNFGFGISYLLPIIVTGLLAERDTIFIVENPEAHLHPCGQSHIGRFLAQVAFSGVQVIVETHSEHVINGIRLHALKYRISPERICINNFSIADGKPHVERVPLNENMDILEWPEGFYDQEERDLAEMRHLRIKR